MVPSSVLRIGVVGTGFIARHFIWSLDRHHGHAVGRVLTRRAPDDLIDFPRRERLTTSLGEVLEHSDVILECTGDPIYATDVVAAAVEAGVPVVTMNAEFHVTAGSYFVGKGLISEAEGDQPGCQAALHEEILELGFEPLVFGNLKGFLNHDPTLEDMTFWGRKQGITLPMVTAFTDGTKLQIEQALVANGLGATIGATGLLGPAGDDLKIAADRLASAAEAIGAPIADYVLSPKLPHGVFLVGKHDSRQQAALRYLRLGDGPYYLILKNNIFVHLEILKTIKRLVNDGRILLDNSDIPSVSVAAVAKRDMRAGERIPYGIGSFDVRGEAVRITDYPGHLPIGLLYGGVIRHPLRRGDILTMTDVDLPESLALKAWKSVETRVLGVLDNPEGSDLRRA
ncbi:MAG TPA: hypothetical protein VEB64_05870 [Azospirillaceae bacterium]|nr:hypothetical protein [Azospirillaceae bacterium]